MNKAFTLWLWENDPSVNTPLSAEFLNRLNNGLNEVDNRVVQFDSTKANQSDMLTAVADVTFDESTGVFTITKKNGSVKKYDTKIEKLAINFSYDKTNQRLVITLDDGTIQYVDLKALITELEFLNSNTVLFSVTDGKVSANIAKGSITDDMIEANYLANVKLYASNALSYANDAKTQATSASKSAENALEYAKRAETAESNCNDITEINQGIREEISNIVNGAVFTLNPKTGNLEYTSPNYTFSVNTTTGKLEYELEVA